MTKKRARRPEVPIATSEPGDLPAMLRTWRDKALLPQTSAAIMLGVSLKTYQGWEQGRAMPYPQLLALAIQAVR